MSMKACDESSIMITIYSQNVESGFLNLFRRQVENRGFGTQLWNGISSLVNCLVGCLGYGTAEV